MFHCCWFSKFPYSVILWSWYLSLFVYTIIYLACYFPSLSDCLFHFFLCPSTFLHIIHFHITFTVILILDILHAHAWRVTLMHICKTHYHSILVWSPGGVYIWKLTITSLLRIMWAVHTVTCDWCPSGQGRMKWCFLLSVSMQAHSPNFPPAPRKRKNKPKIKAATHANPLAHVSIFERSRIFSNIFNCLKIVQVC